MWSGCCSSCSGQILKCRRTPDAVTHVQDDVAATTELGPHIHVPGRVAGRGRGRGCVGRGEDRLDLGSRIARTPEFAGSGGPGRRVDDVHGVGQVEDDPRSCRVQVRVLGAPLRALLGGQPAASSVFSHHLLAVRRSAVPGRRRLSQTPLAEPFRRSLGRAAFRSTSVARMCGGVTNISSSVPALFVRVTPVARRPSLPRLDPCPSEAGRPACAADAQFGGTVRRQDPWTRVLAGGGLVRHFVNFPASVTNGPTARAPAAGDGRREHPGIAEAGGDRSHPLPAATWD